jgi:hypothetical protein
MPVLPVLPTHKYCIVNNLGRHPQHGMEEVTGSIPVRSTKQTLTNQIATGSSAPPSFGDFVSFCVKDDNLRFAALRRPPGTVPADADFFRPEPLNPRNSRLIELIVDCTLAGISCM